jgi:D-glycero-D-manno-heptose 1,7-bisphosphate phosphatase
LNRAALFLDRDGVINIDHAYVCKKEEFEFVDGIFELCRSAKQLGFLICVVTNQAGIGRGYYTEADFLELTDWMCGVFCGEGAAINKVYFSPTHPEHGIGEYKVDSVFRKPGPGMILQAAQDLDIDLARSILVGDKESDIEAGASAGVHCNLLYCSSGMIPSKKIAATAIVTKLQQVIPYLERP